MMNRATKKRELDETGVGNRNNNDCAHGFKFYKKKDLCKEKWLTTGFK